MRNRIIFLLPIFFIFSSCLSINSNLTEMGIPSAAVYFSFDDGPNGHEDTTLRLLDVLKKYNIRALFFLLGENAMRYPDIVKRMHEDGHYIANHGYSDKHAYGMSDDEFRDNLRRGEDAISAALGFEMNPKLYRPHGGFYSARQEEICVDEEGYLIVPVTVRVYDAVSGAEKRKKVINKTVNLIKKRGGGLVLLHDGRDSYTLREKELKKNPNGAFNRSWIPDAVEEIIITLQDSGYNLNGPDVLTAIGADQ